MTDNQIGGGGRLEKFLTLFGGALMACLGAFAAKYCYIWATTPIAMDYRWAYVTGSGVLAFFMLRGALAVALKRDRPKRIEMNSGGR